MVTLAIAVRVGVVVVVSVSVVPAVVVAGALALGMNIPRPSTSEVVMNTEAARVPLKTFRRRSRRRAGDQRRTTLAWVIGFLLHAMM